MGKIKKELKFFTITQHKQEEEYLCSMHRMGWKFTKVVFPGLYYFEACEPENVTYRLDYNQEGISHKDEYTRMFADCGWEYLMDFVGYSYFRKATESVSDNEDIFCDDESRLEMMKRVYKGRVLPVVVIFFCIVFPQFMGNMFGYGGGSIVQDVLAGVFAVIGVIYLAAFLILAIQFKKYEVNLHPDDSSINRKYLLIYCLIALFTLILCGAVWFRFSSSYTVTDKGNGFVIETGRLNKSVVKECILDDGDIVKVTHQADGGYWYVSIGQSDVEPVFYGNTYEEFQTFTVTIHQAGVYEIVCKGRNASGNISFEIE